MPDADLPASHIPPENLPANADAPTDRGLALYRQHDGWLTRAEAVSFFEGHPFFGHRFRREQRAALWEHRWAPWIVLVLALAGVLWLALGDWRFGRYVHDLFVAPKPPGLLALNIEPVALDSADAPPGFAVAVREINQYLVKKQWSEAIGKAEALRKDAPGFPPRAQLWVYEILVAGRMTQENRTTDSRRAAMEAYDEFKKLPGNPKASFTLRYSALLTRFEQAGDAAGILAARASERELDEMMSEVKAIRDHFGTQVTSVTDRTERLRRIHVFALARRIAWSTDKQLASNPPDVARWDELHRLLAEWRQRYAGAGREKWPPELLRCEEWFWGRVANVKWSLWVDRDIALGSQHYSRNAAIKNRDEARKALANRNASP